MLLVSQNLNCLTRIHSLLMNRDAPINRYSVISDWLVVSKRADLKGQSDWPFGFVNLKYISIHCIFCSCIALTVTHTLMQLMLSMSD